MARSDTLHVATYIKKAMKNLASLCIVLFACLPCVGQAVRNEKSISEHILASPTEEEIREVIQIQRSKDLRPDHVQFLDTLTLSNGNKLFILSHRVEGNRHYGAVILPSGHHRHKLPVMIFATGGDGIHGDFDITQDFNHTAAQFPNLLGGDLDQTTIVVIPSFRGQTMIINKHPYMSEGKTGDAFNGATTDALALLNVVLQSFVEADHHRISIFGGSRGGTVALLAATRDRRIGKVVAVAAPTDMIGLYHLYPDQFRLLFFDDLINGKISESEARFSFIASSPIYFAGYMPDVQLHHDENDPFVPVSFARKLEKEMKQTRKPLTLYLYNEGIHGFWKDPLYWKRVQAFITER